MTENSAIEWTHHTMNFWVGLGPATGRLWHWWEDGKFASINVGKKVAGRILDGVEHNVMPEVAYG